MINSYSWITNALPYFEQQALYDQINFQDIEGNGGTTPKGGVPGGPGVNNNQLRETVITTLLCPSNDQPRVSGDQSRSPNEDYWWGGNHEAARTDYVGNLGHIWGGWRDCGAIPDFVDPATGTVAGGRFERGPRPGTPWISQNWISDAVHVNGVFTYTSSYRLADIVDGTTNTVMCFEEYHWRGGNTVGRFNTDPAGDAAWINPLAAVGNLRNPINNKNPAWLQGDGDVRCHGMSSNHPGGANAAMGDGSVRFFSQTIDHFVKYSIATRKGKESVTLD